MDTTPVSEIRRTARTTILQVIEDTVRGPVQLLPREDELELRRLIRAAYPWKERNGWKYRVWCQEVRSAIGYQVKKAKRYQKLQKRREESVMPAMRQWAEEHGMIADPNHDEIVAIATQIGKTETLLAFMEGLDAPRDPDLGPISEGHVCKHGVRWPHECRDCEAAAWEAQEKITQP